jgi:hypothetical protein
MLNTISELQRALYGNWQEDDMGCRREGLYCRFCGCWQPNPTREYHMPDCPRLDYIAHYYNIKPRKSKNTKYRNVIVDGKEFIRSGIYGWWRTNEEFKPLIEAAFEAEGN